MKLNPNKKRVEEVREQLKEDSHCPCMIVQNDDTICPCKPCREKGVCICKLYIRDESEE